MFRYFAIKDEDASSAPFNRSSSSIRIYCSARTPGLGDDHGFIRRLWPRFMKMRTLMVGCAAGEGHLDGAEQLHRASAEILAASITGLAREMNAPLIVLKEFWHNTGIRCNACCITALPECRACPTPDSTSTTPISTTT